MILSLTLPILSSVVMPPSEDPLTAWDYVRYAWSTFATLGSVCIVFYGISKSKYVLPTPPGATFIIFFLALTMLFYLEGLMIAIVAIQYWDRYLFFCPKDYRNCHYTSNN